MSESKEKLLIDIHELSALIGIKTGTLYHWVSQGRLPCVRFSARCLRFSMSQIQEWLEEHRKPALTNHRKGE
jgi:excisionase family DNA binding protein